MSRKTRKLIWSVPLVAMLAVVGALAIFAALAPAGAQAQEVMVPGPVTELEATAKSRSSVELTWTAPITGAPTGYRVDYSDDNREWVLHRADTGSTSSRLLIDQGITTETQRHYRVFAINAAGTGPVSKDPVTAFVSVADTYPAVAPSRVTLTLSVVGPNQINLRWTEPTDNGGSKVTGYKVVEMVDADNIANNARQECLVDGMYDAQGSSTNESCLHITAIVQGTERTAEHKSLNAGSTHYYRVIATTGFMSASDVRGARTTAPTAPSAPREPVAVGYIDPAATLDLYWLEPTRNGGHMLGAHIIEARARTRPDADTPYGALTPWKEVLQNGDTTVLRAGNGGTLIAFSAAPPTETGRTTTNPGDAYNLRLSQVVAGQYQFRMRSAQNDTPMDKGLNLKSAWANFNGGRSLDVPPASRMVTEGASGGGFTVPTTTPLLPDLTAEALDTDRVQEQGIRLTWTASAGTDMVVGLNNQDTNPSTPNVNDDGPTPSDFRIDYADMAGATCGAEGSVQCPLSWQRGQTRTVTLNGWDNEGLEAGTTRYYRLFPINGNVFGEAAIAGEIVAVANIANPDQVLNLRQTGKTTTSITMGWDALPGADGYEVSHAMANESDGVAVATGPGSWSTPKKVTDTSYTHMGLLPGTQRWYRVVALSGKAVVPGTAGNEALGMTEEAGQPGTPIGLVAESAADSSYLSSNDRGVLLLWDRPDDTGKDPTTSYRVEWKSDTQTNDAWEALVDDTSLLERQTAKSTHYHHETPEVADDEQRAYRVRALSGSGAGMPSNESYYPPMAGMAELGMPGNAMSLMAGSPDDSDPAAIKLTWEAGANATTHTVAGVLRNADGTFDTSTAIWMTDVTSPLKVEMDDRPEGTYIFGVVAGLIDGTDREWSDWARATVAYPQ